MTPLPGGGRAQSPGPWRWEWHYEGDNEEGEWRRLYDAQEKNILGEAVAVSHADADLIAAAPQLLEELRKEHWPLGRDSIESGCLTCSLLFSLEPPKVTP